MQGSNHQLANTAMTNVILIGPIAKPKGPCFQQSLSVCVCVSLTSTSTLQRWPILMNAARSEIRDLGTFGTQNWARRSAGIPKWGNSDLGRNRAVNTNRLVNMTFGFHLRGQLFQNVTHKQKPLSAKNLKRGSCT